MKVEDIEKNNKSSQREEYKGTALFDDERIGKTLQTLQEYKRGKASIDEKATANHEWWRLRHWNVIQGETNVGTDDGKSVGSAWTVNSILNKHADIMDSYPKPNVLPREADDEEEAEMLTRILPVIEEQNEAEQVYDAMGYDFLIDGTAITGVFWDNTKHDGMGDILKTNVDIHNVFWQPGITDIQDSEMFFHVAIDKADSVKAMYPEIEKYIGAYDSGLVSRYIHDDTIDTTNDVEIIDCYYKKVVMKPVVMNGGKGAVVIHQIPSTQVHLAKIICGKCVFCSEGMEGYEEGFYNHGKYPFVFRRLFPIKDSPCGFGYLDIMKNPQKDIDKLDQAILRNTLQIAKKRWWVKKNADIDRKAFADWDEELVEVGTGDLGNAVMEMRVDSLPGIVENYRQYKIEELKETSGNRDFSQGSTQSGVTAASAINKQVA